MEKFTSFVGACLDMLCVGSKQVRLTVRLAAFVDNATSPTDISSVC